MAKAAKTTKATKKAAAASSKGKGKGGKENVASNQQKASGNGGRGGTKKKSGGGSAGGVGIKKKFNGGVTKAVQKKIDAWWTKNSDTLVKIAVEEHHCVESTAKDAVKAYQQFLQVKREMQDWENKLLPCHRVIEMLEIHMKSSDAFDYQSDMKFVCGHDFEGKLVVYGKDDDIDRERMTFESVKERFGSDVNDTLWNTTVVTFYDMERDMDIHYGVSKSDPLESAFEKFATDHPDLSLSDFQFLLYRSKEAIDPSDTASGLGLVYSDEIVVLHKDDILLEVKKQGPDSSKYILLSAVGMTDTMTTKLSDLVHDDEDDETDYVFMFKGKRIYGFETPMSLQMKRCINIIDAIPSQDYKYERCLCCNNANRHVVEG